MLARKHKYVNATYLLFILDNIAGISAGSLIYSPCDNIVFTVLEFHEYFYPIVALLLAHKGLSQRNLVTIYVDGQRDIFLIFKQGLAITEIIKLESLTFTVVCIIVFRLACL